MSRHSGISYVANSILGEEGVNVLLCQQEGPPTHFDIAFWWHFLDQTFPQKCTIPARGPLRSSFLTPRDFCYMTDSACILALPTKLPVSLRKTRAAAAIVTSAILTGVWTKG